MTLLIPLLLRLTSLFERGVPAEEPPAEVPVLSDEASAATAEKE